MRIAQSHTRKVATHVVGASVVWKIAIDAKSEASYLLPMPGA